MDFISGIGDILVYKSYIYSEANNLKYRGLRGGI